MPDDQTTLTDDRLEDDEDWIEEPSALPRRPRRRLLGVGGNPIALTLLAVLLIACGFIGGVLVEKGQSSSSSTAGGAGGLAARFAALRAGTGATGARSGSSAAGAGGFPGAAERTSGQVAYLSGSTLYVTDAEGNTVKVVTSAGTTVTKTVSSHVKSIHPGETVTILGATGKSGAVSAESISAGAAGGGGLAALFGAGRGGSSTTTGGGAGGGGSQALFGNG
ncbi:MAG TPA: hypothetical protein VNR42_07195 [Solirubrobacteraceae bacterium]|nr:hypothetical protein [Solirubrobacteraceae bacterium]